MAGDILNIIQSWVLMLLIYFSGHNAGRIIFLYCSVGSCHVMWGGLLCYAV